MTTFAFLHGAWTGAWIWAPLTAELERRGHHTEAVDLPCDDAEAGLSKYAQLLTEAVEETEEDIVVVAHSLGCLALPLVTQPARIAGFVCVAPFFPEPGLSMDDQVRRGDPLVAGGDEGRAADEDARTFWDSEEAFGRLMAGDLDPQSVHAIFTRLRRQARAPIYERAPAGGWPDIPTTVVIYADDAVVNEEWARRTARERAGVTEPVVLPGSHFGWLKQPEALADVLEAVADRT